ncbi:MAG: MFS transporter [Planctomycetes bacterium]|nr:MFS transporter [Planctomycetota bacterium]
MTESQRPTRVRYVILALTVCVAVLLYLDRYCLGYITPYVREGMRLTPGETGFMLSAFFLTYAFGQLPGGWLADRFGTRIMLASYLAVWSVLTGLISFADGFAMLLLLRFGCGLFEAGGYPACAGLIRRWIPHQQRGLASGIVSLGGRIGGAITPAITGFFMLAFMPVSAPSVLTDPAKDLLDARGFARDVLHADASDPPASPIVRQAAARLRGTMSSETRQAFDEVAALPDRAQPTKRQLDVLAGAINGWIRQPDLLHSIDLDPIEPKLTRQALDLLDDAETPTSADKTTRINRYLLEVIFPGRIRQVLGDGWPPVLLIYGVIGVLLAVVFFLFHRDTPRQHFMTNEAEAALVETHEKKTDIGPPMPAATLWQGILTDRSLWASCIVQFGTNFGWLILGNQLALYLFEVHQVPEGTEKGIMTSLPFFVALPTLILGGWWTDWMTKHYGTFLGRCFPIASTRFATAAAFAACLFMDGAWPVVIMLSIMSVVHDLGLPAIWGYNLDVGKRNVGVVLGWGNMWGNLGGFVSPLVLVPLTGMFADKKTGYDALFLTCAAVFAFIGFVSLFIDASKPIGEKPTADDAGAIRAGEPPIRPRSDERQSG